MVLSINILNNMSITLPVIKVMDKGERRFLVNTDQNFASLIQPGQVFTVISKTDDGIFPVRNGAIQAIQGVEEGIIIKG